jgi:hypothetical protein
MRVALMVTCVNDVMFHETGKLEHDEVVAFLDSQR